MKDKDKEPKPKKKQGPKPGKVIRVDPATWKYLNKIRQKNEPIVELMKRALEIGEETRIYYLLPDSKVICDSIEQARGEAIIRAVRKGNKQPTEKPIMVREVIERKPNEKPRSK